jgi:predicted RNA-binding protein Jag
MWRRLSPPWASTAPAFPVSQTDGSIVLKLTGDSGGVAIGHRARRWNAMTYLAGLSTNRLPGDYMPGIIDSGNYREKRKAVLDRAGQTHCRQRAQKRTKL